MIGGILLPIVVLATGGCERRDLSTRTDTSPPLVVVNGERLTRHDFKYYLPEEAYALTSEERRAYLNRWITTKLLYDEEMRDGSGLSEEVKSRVEQYERDLLADQLVQRVVEKRAVVGEDEIRAYYEAHKREYTTEYRVSHILVNTREDAEVVKAQLGERSFEYLARKYSIDKHSRYGGDLGYLSKGNMIPEFEAVVFGMEVGDVSDIIESEFGYHIIRITDIREAQFKLEYEDVRSEIANILVLEKREAVYDSLVTALWDKADIEFTDAARSWVGDMSDSSAWVPGDALQSGLSSDD